MSRSGLRRDRAYTPKHKVFYDETSTVEAKQEQSIGIDLKQIGELLGEIEQRKYKIALLKADLRLINNISVKIEEKVRRPIESQMKNE